MRVLLMMSIFAISLSADLSAQGTNGHLVVLNKGDAMLVTVDVATGNVLGRVATGEGPHEVAVSEESRTPFVANYGTGAPPGSTCPPVDLPGHSELRRGYLSPLRRPPGSHSAAGKVYVSAEV